MATQSPLYHRIKKTVDEKFRRLNKGKIDPWKNFNAGRIIKIERYDGGLISFGVEIVFTGSIRDVFWAPNFIPPFMEEIVLETVAWTFSQCEENRLPPEQPLKEASALLKACVTNSYKKMAGIDQRLSGKGHPTPDQSPLRNVDDEIERMSQIIDKRIISEKKLWKSRQANAEKVTRATKVGKDKIQNISPPLQGWRQVRFCFLNDGQFEIQAAGKNFTREEIFGEKPPLYLLGFLLKIILCGKKFESSSFEDYKPETARKYINRLNSLLTKQFQINQPPITYNRKAGQYEIGFVCETDLTPDKVTPESNTPKGVSAQTIKKNFDRNQ